MKKRLKKLSLSRETLRNLQAGHLRQVVGRGNTNEIDTTCACTDGCGGGGTGGCGTNGCGGGSVDCSDWCTRELITTCRC